MVNQWFLYARSLKILLHTFAMFENHPKKFHFTLLSLKLRTVDIQNLNGTIKF